MFLNQTDIQKYLSPNILEPCCGIGHISKVLEDYGYNVISSDLIDRGFGDGGVDFLKDVNSFDGDIFTNPPYKYATKMIEHALNIIPNGRHVIMLLKLTFLESQQRRPLFDTKQLRCLYVTTHRTTCFKNGDFEGHKTAAVAYGWYDWQKGYNKDPIIKWFN